MEAPIEMRAAASALDPSTRSSNELGGEIDDDSTIATARLLPEESLTIEYARPNDEEGDDTQHIESGKSEAYQDGNMEKSPTLSLRKWLSILLVFHDFKEVLFLIITAINALPVALLLGFAPQLNQALGKSACLPNGNFVLPGTTSIWDPALFFAITINLQVASKDEDGWSYAQVKIIDMMWDVIVGRGGQILLLCVAYRVFNMSLIYAMETQSVSFCTYGTVAFKTGSLSSIWTFIYAAIFDTHFQVTWRTGRILALMSFATVYICSVPTLVSAMTGYAAITSPSLVSPASEAYPMNACTAPGLDESYVLFDCDSGLLPAAMYVADMDRVGQPNTLNTTKLPSHSRPTFLPYGDTSAREYYDAYKQNYDEAAKHPACFDISTLSDCPPLNQSSTLVFDDGDPQLDAPMLDIRLLGNDSSTGLPDAWTCKGFGVYTEQFTSSIGYDGPPGTCAVSSKYLWGFSFQVLLGVTICNCICAVIMYGRGFEVKRNSVMAKKQSEASISSTNPGFHGTVALGNEGEAIASPP